MAAHGRATAETLGALLARVRSAQGRSQLRVAELLCASSGTATVTRHEVSRWERDLRLPSRYWLRWLAVALDVPLDELERAAAATRARRVPPPRDTGPVFGAMLAFRDGGGPDDGGGPADLSGLRALDDLVGGADLARLVNGELRATAARIRREPVTGRPDRRARARLAHLAGLAQLAGWVNADAGDAGRCRAAHRLGLRAAGAAGDRALVGHLLGTAAHLSADPRRALTLARAGLAEVERAGSAATRALLLQRVAYAAARAGDRHACEGALAAADTMYGRRDTGADPDWVYWLSEAEFAAMTGRCYARLGRARLAIPLLTHALASLRLPRAAAIYRYWLAEAHLTAREVEPAATSAGEALLDAVRAGSVRAAVRARAVHARLLATGGADETISRYADVAAEALPYLPGAGGSDGTSGQPGPPDAPEPTTRLRPARLAR
jgi:hypothetical protein